MNLFLQQTQATGQKNYFISWGGKFNAYHLKEKKKDLMEITNSFSAGSSDNLDT